MSSKGNAKESVLKYLETQNRPYSANDITQNLHKEFGKTAIQKALDDLTSEGKLREKVYGKQKVYSVLQMEGQGLSNMETELAELDSKIADVSGKLTDAEQQLKQNEALLRDLENQPMTQQALKEKTELELSIDSLQEKLSALSKSTVKISNKEKEVIYKENEKFMKEYRKRKRICTDILNSILENCPKPKKAFFEEVGIETDEDVGCNLSSKTA